MINKYLEKAAALSGLSTEKLRAHLGKLKNIIEERSYIQDNIGRYHGDALMEAHFSPFKTPSMFTPAHKDIGVLSDSLKHLATKHENSVIRRNVTFSELLKRNALK